MSVVKQNKKNMKVILQTILDIWEKHPELRIGQLILDAVPESRLYYASDETVLRRLCEYYGVTRGEPPVNMMDELWNTLGIKCEEDEEGGVEENDTEDM